MSAPTLRLYAPDADPIQDLKDDAHERLHLLIEEDGGTGCWVYTGPWQRDGNGVIRVGGRQWTAHRVAAWVYLGGFELGDPAVRVEHDAEGCCPACVNPEHLTVTRRAAALRRAA